jgi:uncharacterized protein YjdB
MNRTIAFLFLIQITIIQYGQIIDHACTNLQSIPVSYINQAKATLHIAYEHTSHGSQIIDGMTGLYAWKGNTYAWNDGGLNSALDIQDYGITGGSDLGAPDWTSWAESTRIYLSNPANSNINVVMWAWCGQVSDATESNINTYLNLMTSLENEFPKVRFVYMTGHLDGTGISGTLNTRNIQIRNYCKNNNKVLYDFADIESYDPDGNYYLDKLANDACDYDSNGDAVPDKNWATEWQNTHIVNVDWYNCTSAHSQPLNANRKAYAAWWMFARLAGWTGPSVYIPISGITVTGAGDATAITKDKGTLQLSALITPSNATNTTVTWSISNITGQATISPAGLVTAGSAGTVTAKAAANDGSGIFGTLVITISNQFVPVTTVTVSGTNGSSFISADNGTLQLNASVSPSNATNKAVLWSISDVTGKASIDANGLVTADADGTVTAKATAADGSGAYGTLTITVTNQLIPVENIIVTTESGNTIVSDAKSTLQLTAQVNPTIATVKTVDWSIENITGQASITPTGLLTAINEGTVEVAATATDGTGVKGTIKISIESKRGEPIYAVITGQEIRIPLEGDYSGSKLSIYDLQGNLISSQLSEGSLCTFNASYIRPGIYIIVLSRSVILRVGKIVIPG